MPCTYYGMVFPSGVDVIDALYTNAARQTQITNQNGATSGFEMCFSYQIPAQKVLGVSTKTRLETRFCHKEF